MFVKPSQPADCVAHSRMIDKTTCLRCRTLAIVAYRRRHHHARKSRTQALHVRYAVPFQPTVFGTPRTAWSIEGFATEHRRSADRPAVWGPLRDSCVTTPACAVRWTPRVWNQIKVVQNTAPSISNNVLYLSGQSRQVRRNQAVTLVQEPSEDRFEAYYKTSRCYDHDRAAAGRKCGRSD